MEDLKTKTINNVVWKFLERFIAQGIAFIVSLVIARILEPSDYGVVSIVTIFFNIANVLITGGLNTALIQKKDSDSEDYSAVLFFSLLMSIIVYLFLFFMAPVFASIYKIDSLIIIIRVMGLSLPITAVKSIWCAYISSKLLFKKFFFATLGGTIVSGVVGIYMALNGYGVWALVVQQMSNTIIDTVILILCTRIGIVFKFSLKKLKNLLDYGWKILVSSLISAVYGEIIPLIMGIKFSKEDLSFYTKGKSFPNLLSSATTSTLSAVIFPVLAKVQDDKEKILKYTRLFMRLSSFVIFPCMIGFFAIADTFVLAVLTEKWFDAVFYIRIFCVCSMFDIIAVGNCETIKAIGRSDVFLKMEIIKKSLYLLIIILFVIFADSPIILSVSSLICVIIQIVVNSIPNKRLIDYNYRFQIYDILKSIVAALLMGIIVMLFGKFVTLNIWLKLIIQLIIGIFTYIIISLIIKNDSIKYLIDILKSRFKKNNEVV